MQSASNLIPEKYYLYAKSRLLLEPIDRTFSKVLASELLQSINRQKAYISVNILENAIDQLSALGGVLVRKSSFSRECVKEVAKRFFDDDPVFDLESGEFFEDSMAKKKVLKIYFDSAKIIDLLQKLTNELKQEYTYTCLKEFLNDMNDFKENKATLFRDEKKNHHETIALKYKLLYEERDSKNREQELIEKVSILKDDTEDKQFWNLIRTRYIDEWEQSRIDQTHIRCYLAEVALEDVIVHNKNMIDKENRISSEIQSFIRENQDDMEKEIFYWQDKYDTESERITTETQIIREKHEELTKNHTALKELYYKRKIEIEDFLVYKEKKRIDDEHQAFLSTKVVKVQAWWRGLMVRLHLGPYNPNPKKKGSKGKKGKKDKKKGKKK